MMIQEPRPRTARVERITKESSVLVELDLDGSPSAEVHTGLPFFDHMLTALGTHGALSLVVNAAGDVEADAHHTVEDVSIVLGQAIATALGDKSGINRFGDAWVPLDEALVHAVIDASGRAYCAHTGEPEFMAGFVIGGHYPTVLNRHVFCSLATHAQVALHVRVLDGRDPHHVTEAQFKAVARALRAAVALDTRASGIPSTKGTL